MSHRKNGFIALAVAGIVTGGTLTPAIAGTPDIRGELDAIVKEGTPGVIARVNDRGLVAGVADRATGRRRQADERFRIASLTKPFTATVLLRLAADPAVRLSLDDTVEKWLPGLVQGNGYDGRTITIRQLLNHTSGIYNYNNDKEFLAKFSGEAFLEHRYDGATPEELVAAGISNPPVFKPGAKGRWHYSDTNYILAGMIIEKATGNTYAHEVERRVIRPLGLRSTSVPGRSPRVPAPAARHYSTLLGDKVHDVTEFDPSVAGAAGQLISTTRDITTFWRALLGGRFLSGEQRREMFTTVGVEGDDGHGGKGDEYGLGVRKFRLSCQVWVWGHGGMLPGSLSRVGVSMDGRTVVSLNRNADWGDQALEDRVIEKAFCPPQARQTTSPWGTANQASSALAHAFQPS
ncbi:serine hydrolase domain-containing protein [Spirillospora sp. CA-294931]|uniref:serine hydrolase domain-containing protein n=1 Tax=Spirillospora sp. CA-294931 TaxID=3240042 RepID=UPI003D8D6A56